MNPSYKFQSGSGLIATLIVLMVIGVSAVAVLEISNPEEKTNISEVVPTDSVVETPITEEVFVPMTETEEKVEEAAQVIDEPVVDDSPAIITLAGGCFWCTEAYLQETPGVLDAVSGYAGGSAETATYLQVSKSATGHREAVQVTYDPKQITISEILDVYWSHIDPTDVGGQFADRGFQYTTAIFYHTEAQKNAAEASKADLGNSGLFDKPIATIILPYTTFFPAEEYHQDFYQKSAERYEEYKKGSGRAGFIDDNWAKQAAIEFLSREEGKTINDSDSNIYQERTYSEEEIAAGLSKLDEFTYHIVAEEGTEKAYDNEYWDNKEEGIYVDVVTGRPLFSSTHKYDSKTGWPSFYEPINIDSLIFKVDYKLNTPRTEVRSESGHLGHVFNDGPDEYGGKRYCINSAALNFIPKAEMVERGYQAYLYLFE